MSDRDYSLEDWMHGISRAERAGDAVAATKLRERASNALATGGMGTMERAAANVGAGMSNIVEGAKQLTGFGGTDEELRAKRRRDTALAESSETGRGPDWLPSGGSALQFAGEVAPTLAIPGGLAAKGLGALPKVALPRAMQATAAGAIGGGAGAALMPVTEDESRVGNVAIGTTLGAALPGAMAAAGAAKRAWTGQAPQKLIDALTDDFLRANPGMDRAAAQRAAVQQAEARVQGMPGAPQGGVEVPLTTASATQSPGLAMAERASRAKAPEAWHPLDVRQNEAAWENVRRATAGGDELAQRQGTRRLGWTTREADAMANIDPRAWGTDKRAFRAALEQAERSPAGQNEMRGVIREIQRQMDELGPEFSPQHMARLRSRMAGNVRGAADDAFASAPKSDPYYMSLRDEMDKILNKTTGNKWQQVLEGYAAESAPVAEAKGLNRVRGQFVSPEGVARAELSGTPRVTQAKLAQGLAAGGENRFGDVLGQEPRGVLQGTLDALRRQQLPQELKGSGTAGGGSNTLMDTAAMARHLAPQGSSGSMIFDLARAAVRRGANKESEQLMAALQNPQEFVRMVQGAMSTGQPVPASYRAAAQAIISGSAGVGAAELGRQ